MDQISNAVEINVENPKDKIKEVIFIWLKK